jgi:FkbM family methyltransferase
MAFPPTDRYVGRSLDTYGEFSEAELQLLGRLVHAGDTVLDVGAHVGVHTVFLAGRVGAGGRVLSFEPQRPLFDLLRANIALNRLRQVHPRHAAVSDVDGSVLVPEAQLECPANFGGLSLEEPLTASPAWRQGEAVPTVRIDDLELERPTLIKIDVEGMEAKVLGGADATIARCRPVLYVENDREQRSDELLRRLMALDYRLFWHLPPLYSPDNFFGEEENVFPGLVSANVLALPRSAGFTPPSDLLEIRIEDGTLRPSLRSLFT